MSELTWAFPPDVPTRDLLRTYHPSDRGCLGLLLDDLVWLLEQKEFQTWEAVARQEQGLPLSEMHRDLLARLLDFSDEPGESRILYIDGLPRPKEPWYATVRRVVPHLLVEPFRTFDIHDEETTEGWPRLAAALEEHGEGLSLPGSVSRPVEVVPAELRHRLWLQSCFDHLSGLGQGPELTLADPEEHYRIDEFVADLRRCRESVGFLGLTLDKMLSVVVLPDADVPRLVEAMKERLGLSSGDQLLVGRL